MEKRKPNTQCYRCQTPVYRRPWEQVRWKSFCSKKCMIEQRRIFFECPICHKNIQKQKSTQKYCSRPCSNVGRTDTKYIRRNRNLTSESKVRFEVLKKTFQFQSCMVDGCFYNKTYDVHRLIEGKHGGKYEIGNMFAICPNHHAESHRKLIKFVKVSDELLKEISL